MSWSALNPEPRAEAFRGRAAAAFVGLILTVSACTSAASTAPSSAPVTSTPASSQAAATGAPSSAPSATAAPLVKVRYVLPWIIQGESAGNLVAQSKGFYAANGLDVQMIPGGPNVDPTALVASGSAEFGTASDPSTIMGARNEGTPIKMIYTQMQLGGGVLICKTSTGIKTWKDLKGKKIGVWIGAGDVEIKYALDVAGVGRDNATLLPQQFSMVEFYENKFDCASATTLNELHTVLDAGYAPTDLTVLDPASLGINYNGDVVFTTDKMISDHPDQVQAFETASLQGWMYAFQHPEEAAQIVLTAAPDLDMRHEFIEVNEVARLMIGGAAKTNGIGFIQESDLDAVMKAAIEAQGIPGPVDLKTIYTDQFWTNVPATDKVVPDWNGLMQTIATNSQDPLVH